MIVDSHTHIWTPVPDHPQPNLTTVSPVCDVPITLLNQYMDGHAVERAVLVQPLFPGYDNSLVADCAAAAPDKFAAVAVVDPREADAGQKLEYWCRERGCRGLRLRPVSPAEEPTFGHPDSDPVWRAATQLNIAINVLCGPQHLERLNDLAGRYPDVDVIVDHFGHPDIHNGRDGFGALLKLAARERVHVKVSGYAYFSGNAFPYADCEELNRCIFEEFGPRRLIWGSDFPHVLLKCGYHNAISLSGWDWLDATDCDLMLGGNAMRLYW